MSQFGRQDFKVSDRGLFRVSSTTRKNPLADAVASDDDDEAIQEGFDESGECVITLHKPERGGFGLTLGSQDGQVGVFVAGVKPDTVAEEVLEEHGIELIDGLRFKSLNGQNVYNVEKKDCVAAMRACGEMAIVVFVREPDGFASWADSEEKFDLAEQARVKARSTWLPVKQKPSMQDVEETIEPDEATGLDGFDDEEEATQAVETKTQEPAYTVIEKGTVVAPSVVTAVVTAPKSSTAPVTVVNTPIVEMEPPTQEELNMDLAVAQATMVDSSLDDLHPKKMIARKVLHREAARIEKLIADMGNFGSDDDDDDRDDNDGGAFTTTSSATAVTVTAPPPSQSPQRAPSKKQPKPTKVEAPSIDVSGIDMDLATAQTIMAKDELSDDHPDKVAARVILLAEAQRIDRMIAAMDNSESEDEEIAYGFDDQKEETTTTAPPPTTTTTTTTPPPPPPQVTAAVVVEPPKPAVVVEKRTEDIVAANLAAASKMNRKYATEDERVAAEVNVDETNARMNSVSFDFGFGFDSKAAPKTTTTTAPAPATLPPANKLAQFDFSNAVNEAKNDTDDVASKEAQAREAASKIARAGFDAAAIKQKEDAEYAERINRLAANKNTVVPKLAPVNRKYATEEERVQAEVNVNDAIGRVAGLDFDFSFGAPAPAKVSAPKPTEANTPKPSFSYKPPSSTTSGITSSTTSAPKPSSSSSYFKPPATVMSTPTPTSTSTPTTTTAQTNTTKVVPKIKIDRKFATEDERVQAEASVEATSERLSEMKFDFAFG